MKTPLGIFSGCAPVDGLIARADTAASSSDGHQRCLPGHGREWGLKTALGHTARHLLMTKKDVPSKPQVCEWVPPCPQWEGGRWGSRHWAWAV